MMNLPSSKNLSFHFQCPYLNATKTVLRGKQEVDLTEKSISTYETEASLTARIWKATEPGKEKTTRLFREPASKISPTIAVSFLLAWKIYAKLLISYYGSKITFVGHIVLDCNIRFGFILENCKDILRIYSEFVSTSGHHGDTIYLWFVDVKS